MGQRKGEESKITYCGPGTQELWGEDPTGNVGKVGKKNVDKHFGGKGGGGVGKQARWQKGKASTGRKKMHVRVFNERHARAPRKKTKDRKEKKSKSGRVEKNATKLHMTIPQVQISIGKNKKERQRFTKNKKNTLKGGKRNQRKRNRTGGGERILNTISRVVRGTSRSPGKKGKTKNGPRGKKVRKI